MNALLLSIIIKTIPKVDANNYEDSKLIVKQRKEWKTDIINDIFILIVSLISFISTDKVKIPYIGTFLFIGGFLGSFYGVIFSIRAYLVYKYYYDIFKEEDIKKLE